MHAPFQFLSTLSKSGCAFVLCFPLTMAHLHSIILRLFPWSLLSPNMHDFSFLMSCVAITGKRDQNYHHPSSHRKSKAHRKDCPKSHLPGYNSRHSVNTYYNSIRRFASLKPFALLASLNSRRIGTDSPGHLRFSQQTTKCVDKSDKVLNKSNLGNLGNRLTLANQATAKVLPRSMTGTRVTVVCLRHGETNFNREKRLQGQLDTELSDLGQSQARVTANFLREKYPDGFDAVVSSDLRRAYETAQASARAFEDPPHVLKDSRLRELHVGILQGKRLIDARRDPATNEVVERFYTDASYKIPDGESRQDMFDRASTALEDAVVNVADQGVDESTSLEGQRAPKNHKRLLLVAHGGVLSSLFNFVKDYDLDSGIAPHTSNCSIGIIHAFVMDGSVLNWEIAAWNQGHHVQEISTKSEVL